MKHVTQFQPYLQGRDEVGAFAALSGTVPLAPGYTAAVDTADEQAWNEILQRFEDANIYQTWAYVSVRSGHRNISHLILRHNGDIAAVSQVRIARLPVLNIGVAYVRWGPLWRGAGAPSNVDVFRQALRALRNEFACKRRLVLRVFPYLFGDDSDALREILRDEGFDSIDMDGTQGRTILMDIRPPLENLRDGMKAHWRRELAVAERNKLAILEGSEPALFDAFIRIYKEMVARKKFVEPNDINQFRVMQGALPNRLKMLVMLCTAGETVYSGLICSAVGNTAVYLFGATSDAGLKSRGSYLLHWNLLDRLKQRGISVYDLNGINPGRNPGTYKFKNDLAGDNGRDARFLGRFDSYDSSTKYFCIRFAEALAGEYSKLKGRLKKAGDGVVRRRGNRQ